MEGRNRRAACLATTPADTLKNTVNHAQERVAATLMASIGITYIPPIKEAKMNNTRIFSPAVLLSLAVAAVLLLSVGFAAWLNQPETGIAFGGPTVRQGTGPEPVAQVSAGINPEGLATYFRSEHGTPSSPANREGMALYHASEWGTNPAAQDIAAGLEIYRLSERTGGSLAAPISSEVGMAIYQQSEHNFALGNPAGTIDAGMAIYRASEWGR